MDIIDTAKQKKNQSLPACRLDAFSFLFCWARDMATRSPYTDLLTFSFITDSILLELLFIYLLRNK